MSCTTVGPVTGLSGIVVWQTLPGWPTAPSVSIIYVLVLMVGLPLLIGGIVWVASTAAALARRGHSGAVSHSDPVWIGRANSSKALTADAAAQETGGTSARW